MKSSSQSHAFPCKFVNYVQRVKLVSRQSDNILFEIDKLNDYDRLREAQTFVNSKSGKTCLIFRSVVIEAALLS